MTGSPLSSPPGVRLAELLAVLSLGADLGMGQPMEHAMRQCLIALRLGDRLGLKRDERASLYYVSLIAWVGCHIDAYEQAKHVWDLHNRYSTHARDARSSISQINLPELSATIKTMSISLRPTTLFGR